jgi:nicotinate-nucleotide pyrophosphorylase (carboxylating)
MPKNPDQKIVSLALAEDLGKKDLTARLIPRKQLSQAQIVCQKPAIICGTKLVAAVFTTIDPKIKIDWLVEDGGAVSAAQVLCHLTGPTRSLLTGERTALNFLQILSSTATLTKQLVTKIRGTKTKLLDTRKTIPGLRNAQKYAVKCGGGNNHRFGLYDGILIKENHIASCGSITAAVTWARRFYPQKKLEIEVRNLSELREALTTSIDTIMLDNFSVKKVKAAVAINNNRVKLEASGGINIKNIRAYAQTGVDYISVGTITKTVIPIELSLLIL